MGHGFFSPAAWGFFLEHGLDGWDTDFFACGEGIFWNTDWTDGTRIFFACGVRDFLEHGLDGWDTDFFRLRREGFWNTDWTDETDFSPAAFLDFIGFGR